MYGSPNSYPMTDTPRTLGLNLKLGREEADDATAMRAYHDLAEQLERELNQSRGPNYRQDAEKWGDALNSASWEWIKEYGYIMKEPAPAKLFNCSKTILRAAILKYLEQVEKQRIATKDGQ